MLRFTLKQKQHLFSISRLLLHLIAFIVLLISLNSCELLSTHVDEDEVTCNTFATIKDKRGIDGCGFILQLDNGDKLEPVSDNNSQVDTQSTGPQPSWNGITLKDGKRVKIRYQEVSRATICMMGKPVRLTCISEAASSQARTD